MGPGIKVAVGIQAIFHPGVKLRTQLLPGAAKFCLKVIYGPFVAVLMTDL